MSGSEVDLSHHLAHNDEPFWNDDIKFYDSMTLPLGKAADMLAVALPEKDSGTPYDSLLHAAECEIKDALAILEVWLKHRPQGKKEPALSRCEAPTAEIDPGRKHL